MISASQVTAINYWTNDDGIRMADVCWQQVSGGRIELRTYLRSELNTVIDWNS